MGGRGRWLLAGAASVAVLVLVLLAAVRDEDVADGGNAAPEADAVSAVVPDRATADSPFATAEDGLSPPSSDRTASPSSDERVADVASGEAAPDDPPVDLQRLGRDAIPDAEFEALVARLSRDPALLQALIDEFRSESDPERLKRLAQLLGDVDDPGVVLLATELVYSGDEASRLRGLDLLKRVRPGNADVRDVVSGLLSSESDERILLGTLTAMARPGVVDADTRAGLADQVSLLTRHEEASVRRTSLDILARWSDSPEHTPRLVEALVDESSMVRRTAAYALVDRDGADDGAVRELFAVVDDEGEEERTRRAAILALKSMTLDPLDRERVLETERRLDLHRR